MKKGFTLIELLVTITIIAILATIGLAVYASIVKSSRDSKRQSDLKIIQSALEDYHADNFYYPSAITPGSPLTYGTKTYLNSVPQDPLPSPQPQYNYQALPSSPTQCDNGTNGNCTSYCLLAQMELANLTSDTSCIPPAIAYPSGFSSPKVYGVTRP